MSLSDDEIRRLLDKAKADQRVFKGYTPATVERDGKLYVGLEKNKRGGKRGWVNPGPQAANVDWELPKLAKRTGPQRAESLGMRLLEAAKKDPVQLNFLLSKVQADFWKKGRPIAFDDIQRLATHLLEKAERQASEHRVQTRS